MYCIYCSPKVEAVQLHGGGAGFSESFPGFPGGFPSALRPDTGMKSRLDQVIYDIVPTRFSHPPPAFLPPVARRRFFTSLA